MADVGEWIKHRPVIVGSTQTAPGRPTGLDRASQTAGLERTVAMAARETIHRSSSREQADQEGELPMVWGELWIDQLYADHRRTTVAAFDDFARIAVGQEPTARLRSMLFGLLATASDEEFAELSCTYLEQLFDDAKLSVDHISYLMKLLGRARSDARRELGPTLSQEHHQA